MSDAILQEAWLSLVGSCPAQKITNTDLVIMISSKWDGRLLSEPLAKLTLCKIAVEVVYPNRIVNDYYVDFAASRLSEYFPEYTGRDVSSDDIALKLNRYYATGVI
jgi:hypothetical protein